MSYFESIKKTEKQNKIFLAIIGVMLLLNLIAFKSVFSIASNKTIQIVVPQYLEGGKYTMGSTFASRNVYKMWAKIWIQDLANFSYKDINKKYEEIYPFLSPTTAMDTKAKMINLIKYVQMNFITQTYDIKDIYVSKKGSFTRIEIKGVLSRKIGLKTDPLSNTDYAYVIYTYIKNGQIFIQNIKSYVLNIKDASIERKLKDNKYVNFESVYEKREMGLDDLTPSLKISRDRERLEQKEKNKKEKEDKIRNKLNKETYLKEENK